MRFSVAVATFRGARYIRQQLDSILSQELPPYEVVVFDDASDDGTIEVVREYSRIETTVNFHVNEQPKNLGVIANFESAIRQTTGDVIVLADQDDIWHRDKLATIHQALSQHADWGMVFSDANLVDQNGCSLKQSLWESLRLGQVQRDQLQSPHAFELLLRRYLVTGATLAFRREFLGILLPFSKHLIHDAWIALVISAVSKIGLIERPLIDYRQHPKQVIGERNAMRSWWTQFNAARTVSDDYFVRQRDFFRDLANRIESLRSSWVHSEVGRLAESKANFMDRRIRHRASRFRSLSSGLLKDMISGDYSRFGYGWKSAAQDLLL